MSTTGPVMTVTDELLAGLEELAFECNQHGGNWYEPRHMAAFPEYSCDQDFVVSASPATITALTAELLRLRAENAELAKDAARLEWMLSEQCVMRVQNGTGSPLVYSLWWSTLGEGQINWHKSARDAIDTAMATK